MSRVVSTIASLTTCHRLAPNACRTAISFDAAARPDQKQVRQVDGADQQQGEGARLHPQQSGADAANVVRVQRRHHGTKSGIGHHFGLRDRPLPARHSARRSGPAPVPGSRPVSGGQSYAWNSHPNAAARNADLQGATRKESTAAPRRRGSGSRAAGHRPPCS